jgi:hypothetical protein
MRLGPGAAELVTSALPSTPPVTPALPSAPVALTAAAHPVLAEFEASMAELTAARSAVLSHWASRPAASAALAPVPPPARAPAPPPRPLPVAPRERTWRRRMSLDTVPDVWDHCFFRQPPGWPDRSDKFPVVPMTAIARIMTDVAGELAPGRLAVGLRDLRALRWLCIEPPVDVTITATVVKATERGADEVHVSLDGYAHATVVLADDWPAPPRRSDVTADLVDGRLPGEHPSPEQAEAIYRNFLFHGAAYQGLHHIDALAPGGIRGRLRVPTGSGALLDNVGQLYGYWARRHLDADWVVLPHSLREVRFFGPEPAPGEFVDTTVRIRAVEEKLVRADMESRRADGSLWTLVTGWVDRRFSTDAALFAMTGAPERFGLVRRDPDGWVAAPYRWSDTASRDLTLRHYLDAAGRDRLAWLNPLAARAWLLGQIAARDAVRHELWRRGVDDVWAIEVGVGELGAGPGRTGPLSLAHVAPVTMAGGRVPLPADGPEHVAVAADRDLAVAIAHARPDIGIALTRLAGSGPAAAGETALAARTAETAARAAASATGTAAELWTVRAGRTAAGAADPEALMLTGPAGATRLVRSRVVDGLGQPVPAATDPAVAGPAVAGRPVNSAATARYLVAWTTPAGTLTGGQPTDPAPGSPADPAPRGQENVP